jgi:hypothetical protein
MIFSAPCHACFCFCCGLLDPRAWCRRYVCNIYCIVLLYYRSATGCLNTILRIAHLEKKKKAPAHQLPDQEDCSCQMFIPSFTRKPVTFVVARRQS